MNNDSKKLFFCVVGIEYGMSRASNIRLMGTFSTVDLAHNYIENEMPKNIFTLVDILETYIDILNENIENSLSI